MISILRRFANSKIGAVILGVILIAFIVTLYEGKSGLGLGGGTGTNIATAGKFAISDVEAQRRVQNQLDAARQQQPTLDMAAFAAAGGVEQTVNRLIDERAMESFAGSQGLVASKKLIDGAIASIPAFNGPTGQFDRNTFEAILAQRKLSEAMVRDDFTRAALMKALLVPVAGGVKAPAGLAAPYAALLLEVRKGEVGVVPVAAFAPKTPISDADLATFYKRNIAAYTVPERRTIQYAVFDRTRFDGKVTPTEAEIAAAYQAHAATYAASEKRGFTQVIVASKADADALYAKVRGGMTMDAAAKSAGLEALIVPVGDKAAFAKLTSAKVAEAAFAMPRGGVAPPAQSGLGWHIVRVDSVAVVAAKSLDQARAEIASGLTKTKTDKALSDFVGQLDDELGGGATFDDIVKKYGLAAAVTPPLTVAGLAPDTPGFALPDAVKPLLKDAFQAEAGDEAQVASAGTGQPYVLYHMNRIVPAAPKPLEQIKAQVAADAAADAGRKAAKKAADVIVASINKGIPFAQALGSAGVPLPAAKPAAGQRLAVAQAGDKAPAPIKALFAIAAKHARVLPVEGGAGWYIVYVDSVVPGDARAAAPLTAGVQAEFTRTMSDEMAAQFAGAIKANVGVTRNESAIAALKSALSGAR